MSKDKNLFDFHNKNQIDFHNKNQIDFHNKNQIDFHNKNQKKDFRNKIIKVPEIEYWDKAKTILRVRVEKHDNGSLKSVEHLNQAGKRHGLSEFWYENGNKSSISNHKNGHYHGEHVEYDENGNKWMLGFFKEGEYHGLETQWDENGIKDYERDFKDGKRHGKSVEWNIDGKRENHWIAGKQHGKEIFWHSNGNIGHKGNCKNNYRDGYWDYFDENGALTSTDIWDNGMFLGNPTTVIDYTAINSAIDIVEPAM